MASITRRQFFSSLQGAANRQGNEAACVAPNGADHLAMIPIRPPGVTENAISACCDGCGDCMSACPEGIIQLDRAGHPFVSFEQGGCSFCGACADSCTKDVFLISQAEMISDEKPESGADQSSADLWPYQLERNSGCLLDEGVDCQLCSDHCETGALSFRRVIGGGEIRLDSASCTACGFCVHACPQSVFRIVPREQLSANAAQSTAVQPPTPSSKLQSA